MSVFGVDFGTLSSVVAVTRQGGVDIVCNEVSKRDTASVVSYFGDERLIGESGFDRAVRNYQNTVPCVKRLIGLQADDARAETELKFVNCNTTKDDAGRLMLEVDYRDNTTTLYPEQVLAAYVGKLRKYVATEVKSDTKDCVLSVPAWYTAEQRKLVMQACEMAKLNCMSLINETTAACVDFGIFRQSSLPEAEEEAQLVALVDLGYAGTTITIARFWKGNCKVLAHHWDLEVGTRNLDFALLDKAVEDVKAKYGVDPSTNRKARLRLLQGCDKCKCMLSANPLAPLNVENLMDIDVNMQVKREDLDVLVQPVMEKLKVMIAAAVAKAGVSLEDIKVVECIGGGCRVPSFKTAVHEGFNIAPSFTLNASESIARGCAITAASFSPLFQVRPYVVHEAPRCPIHIAYHSESAKTTSEVSFLPEVNKVITVLGDNDRYPKTLELTFDRTDEFDLTAFYNEEAAAATNAGKGKDLILAKWRVGKTDKPTMGGIKVRVKFEASGLVSISEAATLETYEVEVEEFVQPEKKEGETEEAKPAEGAKKEELKKVLVKKQRSKKLVLSVTPTAVLGHSADVFLAGAKVEAEQDAKDLDIQRTKEARNELESYVYDTRSSVQDGALKPFMAPADIEKFVALANEYEGWLYEDGEGAPLAEYNTRLSALKETGEPAKLRQRLNDDIPFAHKGFVAKIKVHRDKALNMIGREEHISDDELKEGLAKCDEATKWGEGELKKFNDRVKHELPVLTAGVFEMKVKEIEAFVKAIINKPKPAPKPEEEEKKEEAKEEAKEEKKDEKKVELD